ncbi:helix-turn-helix domain-containing protein [Angelakisella massiliensis]|uniref:MerR family transcriptional regulator n=1 Tax=Angelakisella massiliensis TaxID=1871018 RepID=UPI0024B09644|nr:helix-turn-helix domain-containing protein [Angelakisella massiliensis]
MKNLMKIGEMARFNQVSVPTLRLYDRMGLLKPCHIDQDSGYRYYSIYQKARLDMIQYMKELGMSLGEIKTILEQGDIQLIESTLIRKKKQVRQQIAELETRLGAITRAIESTERFRKAPNKGMTTVEYIPHRKIYVMHTDVNFYDHDISVYEEILGQLKLDILRHGLPQLYYCNAGTILPREYFLSQHLESHEIFVFLDDNFPESQTVRRIDSGMFACIYLDRFEDEPAYAAKLLEYCTQNGYTVCGDYLCEVLTEFNVFDSQHRSMFLRLQVPLSFQQ